MASRRSSRRSTRAQTSGLSASNTVRTMPPSTPQARMLYDALINPNPDFGRVETLPCSSEMARSLFNAMIYQNQNYPDDFGRVGTMPCSSQTASSLSDAIVNQHKNYPDDFGRPTFDKGTTSMGFIFDKEGVMVGVDHSSLQPGVPEKVVFLNSHMLATIAGGSEASRQYFFNDLPNKCQQLEREEGRKASPAEASLWVSEFLALNPDSDKGSSLGILVAGCDKGPSLYKVDGKGQLVEGSLLRIGSARSCVITVMMRPHYNFMPMDEAKDLAKAAICHGAYNCPERGAYVSVFHVGSAGIAQVVTNEDIVEFQKARSRKVGREWTDPNTVDWTSTYCGSF